MSVRCGHIGVISLQRLDCLELDAESLACFAQGLQAMTSLKKIR